jgi:uncharacterized protein
MDKFVLDTSALLTFIENEEGEEIIHSLLIQSLDFEVELYVSVISLVEICYISLQEQGENIAIARLEQIKALPVRIIEVKNEMIEVIGLLKSKYRISFADSCIAGLAEFISATLVHKDPEFEQVLHIKQLKLPYKRKS